MPVPPVEPVFGVVPVAPVVPVVPVVPVEVELLFDDIMLLVVFLKFSLHTGHL